MDRLELERRALNLARLLLDHPADEREALLASHCPEDTALAERVRRLLSRLEEVADDGMTGAAGNPEDDAADALIDTQLGPFRVIGRIGRGGMGVVYRGERETADFRQEVALKLIRRGFDFDDVQARFLRERRILARLDHPNLARFIDGGLATDGRPWFALEFVRGRSISTWCDAQRLPIRQRVRLFLSVCAAVQYAHSQLIVHRDLKPDNILIDEHRTVRLLDFGIARLLGDDEHNPALTRSGHGYAMTPEYAAPEQFDGQAVGVGADIYALGAVLYTLITGVPPIALDRSDLLHAGQQVRERSPQTLTSAIARSSGADNNAIAAQRLAARATHAAGYRRMVRGDLSHILEKSLAKEPERRYVSAAAFSEDLQRWLDGAPVRATGNTLRYRMGKFVRRHRAGVAMAVLAVASLLTGMVAVSWQARIAQHQAQSATAMKDYVLDLLRQSEVRDEDDRIRVVDLLERGSAHLHTLPPDSELRAEMLAVILALHRDLDAHERGLALAQAELGIEPDWRLARTPAGLAALTTYAHFFSHLGRHEERNRFISHLAPAAENFPGPRNMSYADSAAFIGTMTMDAGQPERAAAILGEAVTLMEQQMPAHDSRRQSAEVLLAGVLTTLRQIERGRERAERTLAAVDDRYPRMRAYVQNMAALRRALFGEFASAEALFASTRDILERYPDRRLSNYYVHTHASNAFDLGDTANAYAMIERGFEQAEKLTPGKIDGTVFLMRGELAMIENRFDAAAEDYARVVQMHPNQLPDINTIYPQILRVVALCFAGHRDAAWEHWHQANVWIADAAPSIGHTPALLAAAQGVLLMDEGEADVAGIAFAQADVELSQARTRQISVHWQLRENRDEVRIRFWHAQALRNAGNADQAREQARQSLPASLDRLGGQHFFVRALQQLADDPQAASPRD